MLDLALYLMDFPEPVAVSGTTYNLFTKLEEYTYTSMWGTPTPGGRKDVDDFAAALVRFADGRTLQLNVSWALNIEQMNPESGLRLMGDKGGVALKGVDEPHVFRRGGRPRRRHPPARRPQRPGPRRDQAFRRLRRARPAAAGDRRSRGGRCRRFWTRFTVSAAERREVRLT